MTGRNHPTVIAIDPGSRHAGIVARRGSELLAWKTLERAALEPIDTEGWVTAIAQTAVAIAWEADQPVISYALEDLNDPNPHVGMVGLRHLLELARVIGRLEERLHPVLVPPGRHGTGPLALYPPALVGPRETTGRGKGPRQHARAAWDVAGVGALLMRAQAA